ncbi:MAG: hypothetical protein ACRDK9_12175 [Solirubrobacterales bacterium]
MLVLTSAALAAGPESAGATSAKILSPKDGAHVKRDAVVVRTRTKGKRFRAYVDGRNVTGRFMRTGARTRRAVLVRGRDFGPLDNNLQIRVGARFDSTNASVTFTHLERADVAAVKARRRRSSHPVPKVRARTERRLWESRVRVNGERVREGVDRHGDERGLSVELAAHHGLDYGRNTLEVLLLQRNGLYERHKRVVRIPRDQTLTGAGPDREIGVGETVSLDGTPTRPPVAGRDVEYRWRIVDAPAGSEARLDAPTSVTPSLTPDVPGTYEVRLTADAQGAASPGVDEVSVTAPENDDPMGMPIQTITAEGAVQIGSQVWPRCGRWVQVIYLHADTLMADTNYKNKKPRGCGPGAKAYGIREADRLLSDVENARNHIVIITGQAQTPPNVGDLLPANVALLLGTAIEEIGGTTDTRGMTKQGAANLANGQFSVIGNRTLTEGHAEQNFIITQAPVQNPTTPGFPSGPGAPGSLNGFMQKVLGANYEYVSTEYYEIDTKYTPTLGAPPSDTTNTIKVGDQTYPAGAMAPGEVGIQFLVLDPSGDRDLAMRENSSWRILQANGEPDQGGIQQLAIKLDRWVRTNTAPGSSQLVIIQDYGHHFGFAGPGQKSTDWVSDQLPETTGSQTEVVWDGGTYSLKPDNLFASWNARHVDQTGHGTVAGGIGMLAGPEGHDAVANYRMPYFDPSVHNGNGGWVSNDSPGMTVVASTNRYQASSTFFQGQRYNGHQQDPQVGTGRVTGILRRNEQSQWELSSSGFAPGYPGLVTSNDQNFDHNLWNSFNPKALWDLVFGQPTPWPCTPANPRPCPAPSVQCPTQVTSAGPSQMRNAMIYLTQKYQPDKGSGFADIRQLYHTAFNSSWKPGNLPSYPGDGNGFSREVFEALRCQISHEFDLISDVSTGITGPQGWQEFLTHPVQAGPTKESLIENVADKIQHDLEAVYSKVKTQETETNGAEISSNVLLVLESLTEGALLTAEPEALPALEIVPPVFGGLSALIDLGDDVHEATDNDDVGEEVANDTNAIHDQGHALGEDVAERYAAIATTMQHFAEVFVSDWGKLQQAAQHLRGGGIWSLPSDISDQSKMLLSIAVSAKRAAYDALLPMAFTQWVISPSVETINPSGPGNIDNPNPYRCVDVNHKPGDDGDGWHFPFQRVSRWALHAVPWIGEEHPQIGSSPQPATPFTLRGLKSKADDMAAEKYEFSNRPKSYRVGLDKVGTTANQKILEPVFTPPSVNEKATNPSGVGARKDEIFGSGAWRAGEKPGLKKLQCA